MAIVCSSLKPLVEVVFRGERVPRSMSKLNRITFLVLGFSRIGISTFGSWNSTLVSWAVGISSLLKEVGSVGMSLCNMKRERVWAWGSMVLGLQKLSLWKEPTLVQKWLREGIEEIRHRRTKERVSLRRHRPLTCVLSSKLKLRLGKRKEDFWKIVRRKLSGRSTMWKAW